METNIKISGMHCASCEKLLKMAIEGVPGVQVKSISHASGSARIAMPSEKEMTAVKKAVEDEGYKVL
jgi:Cu+-exporting ATPase